MGELGVVNSNTTDERLVLSSGKTSSPPDPVSFTEDCLSAAEDAAQQVLNCIHPTLDSEEKRRDVIDHLQRLIKTHQNCEVFPYGSVPLKTYLPDGDIDLTVLKGPNGEESLAHDVLAILQGEEHNENAEYQINGTQFIDAEVKLVKCLAQNIVIDISFNQLGGLSTLCFLEQVDRLVGRKNLFKRSIILIKAWCFYESRILGATHGLISTYALETLILYIFQLFHSSLSGPLVALYRFLDYFSQFDWDNYCISLKGPVCKSSLPNIVVKMPNSGLDDLLLDEKFMENCMDMFSVPFRVLEANPKLFQTKHLNIIDPLKENNNLGRSVHRGNFYRIRSAFKYGARKLGQVLLQPRDKVAEEINKFFANTLSRHGNHPRSSIEHLSLEFDDEESSTASLSSHGELFSEDDMLLESSVSDLDNDSAGMEEKSSLSFKNELDRSLSREVSSDLASEACYSAEGVVLSGHAITGDAYDLGTTNSSLKNGTSDYSSDSNYSASFSGSHGDKPHYFSSKLPAKSERQEAGNFHKNDSVESASHFSTWLENREKHVEMNNTHKWCMDNSQAVGVIGSGSSTPKVSNLENICNNFREMDLNSTGGESEAIDPLADLSGDYESHIRSLLYGQLSHGFASSACVVSNSPSSPSRIPNNTRWDIVRQSIPLRQTQLFHVHSHTLSVEQTTYPAADSALPITAFRSEGQRSVRGTGTYFPSLNGFYRERPSQGRGRNKASGANRNQFHRYRRSNGSYPAFSRSNSFESGAHEVPPVGNRSQGAHEVLPVGNRSQGAHEVPPVGNRSQGRWKSDAWCPTPFSVLDGNQANGYPSSSCRIEFGSVGNLAEEVISGSTHARGSTLAGSLKTKNSTAEMNQERCARPSIHLKNEDEFPPLCQ